MRKSLCRHLVLGTLMLICAVPITGRAALTTWTLDDVRVSGTAPGYSHRMVYVRRRRPRGGRLQPAWGHRFPGYLNNSDFVWGGAVRAELQRFWYGLLIRDGGFDVYNYL